MPEEQLCLGSKLHTRKIGLSIFITFVIIVCVFLCTRYNVFAADTADISNSITDGVENLEGYASTLSDNESGVTDAIQSLALNSNSPIIKILMSTPLGNNIMVLAVIALIITIAVWLFEIYALFNSIHKGHVPAVTLSTISIILLSNGSILLSLIMMIASFSFAKRQIYLGNVSVSVNNIISVQDLNARENNKALLNAMKSSNKAPAPKKRMVYVDEYDEDEYEEQQRPVRRRTYGSSGSSEADAAKARLRAKAKKQREMQEAEDDEYDDD